MDLATREASFLAHFRSFLGPIISIMERIYHGSRQVLGNEGGVNGKKHVQNQRCRTQGLRTTNKAQARRLRDGGKDRIGVLYMEGGGVRRHAIKIKTPHDLSSQLGLPFGSKKTGKLPIVIEDLSKKFQSRFEPK